MSTDSTLQTTLTRQEWQERAQEFIKMRLGLAGAKENEFMVGYIDGFKGVYATPGQIEAESWYVWFIFPGGGKAARVVNELMPSLYCDHEGNVYEYDPEWVFVLGTITRIGDDPLLTLDMFK
jgi:hypothetical protein